MLEIELPEEELYDEKTREFVKIKATKMRFEHSLVSISKWESKYHKPFPFLNKSKNGKPVDITNEEMIYYLECMCLTQNVDPKTFRYMPRKYIEKIAEYIQDPMTATWFNDRNKPSSKQKIITNELIYNWMAEYGIWKECEKWHINRLLTLIHVCAAENAPKKKMSKSELYERQNRLNAARRKKPK